MSGAPRQRNRGLRAPSVAGGAPRRLDSAGENQTQRRPLVVHLITRLDPGGSAVQAVESCAGLAKRGWDVLLASGPGSGGSGSMPNSGAARIELVTSLTRDPHPFYDPIALWQIVRLLMRERPAILHTHSAKAGVLGRWAGWLTRIPVVIHTPHGHVLYGYARGIKNRIYLLAERIIAPVTDCLIALSDGERRESVEAGIGRDNQWVVVHSGIRLDRLPPANPPDEETGPLRIGVVARLEHVKGVDMLVRAIGELKATDPPPRACKVLIWGCGALDGELRALASELGVGDDIDFVGTEQDVNEFIGSLHIYAQPSRNEGMGRALVIAQAMGVPTVATNVCGIPDVVKDGESGVLARPEDPADLARALRVLIDDDDTRVRMGRRASEWMAEIDESGYPIFSYEAMLWHLQHTYERLVRAPAATS